MADPLDKKTTKSVLASRGKIMDVEGHLAAIDDASDHPELNKQVWQLKALLREARRRLEAFDRSCQQVELGESPMGDQLSITFREPAPKPSVEQDFETAPADA